MHIPIFQKHSQIEKKTVRVPEINQENTSRDDIERQEIERRVQAIEDLARLMDSQFKLPGIPLRLGLDTLIGLIPGIGDTIGLAIAGYIILQSKRLGIGGGLVIQMVLNIFIDWLIGLIPLIGDIFDWGWKGNNKNAALLRAFIEEKYGMNRIDP